MVAFEEYLYYSAKESMVELRKRFNNGECLYKNTPAVLGIHEAIEDVLYLKYVIENAYSGYTYFEKNLFDRAFQFIVQSLNTCENITPNELIDLIAEKLSFISDGHLALSTQDYGRGFYQVVQTYVSDIRLRKAENCYYCLDTGRQIYIDDPLRLFDTIGNDGAHCFLLGIRSSKDIKDITVKTNNGIVSIPVHKIKSKPRGNEKAIEEEYFDDVAIITSSSFVGDSEELLHKFYETGVKCRRNNHVIWDLSNNLGGNSELAKQFLLGLTGKISNKIQTLALQSTLVYAKEYGEVKDIPYHFESANEEIADNETSFNGNLHIIINDMVASSAETAICWASSYQHTTFYGCNSLGIGHFGDLCIYYLPNSKITLWCPQKVFECGISETVGYEPTYWFDSEDVVSIILDRIRN